MPGGKRKLNSDTLDIIEDRFIDCLTGIIDEVPAATLEILRKVLHENGRLTAPMGKSGDGAIEYDDDEDPDMERTDAIPFPTMIKGGGTKE